MSICECANEKSAERYLQDLIVSASKYSINSFDLKFIQKKGIVEFIFVKLMSKKFRKWKVDFDSTNIVRQKIHNLVNQNKPIKMIFPFGGYKLWSLSSAPEVDWAEFFTISYYLSYIAPICAVYAPGVEFYFSSDDVIIEKLDNIPKESTDQYFQSFKALLEIFRKYFPSNLKMEIVRVADFYDDLDFEKELSLMYSETKSQYALTTPERQAKMLKTSALNIQWNGVENWDLLPEVEKRQKLEEAPIVHDAYCKMSKRNNFVRSEDSILVFTTKVPQGIPIGTGKNSITKFWTGYGVLQIFAGKFSSKILSPKQLDLLGSNKFTRQDINLSMGIKNLETIDIYESNLDQIRAK